MTSATTAPPRSYALADLPWTDVAAHLATDRRLLVPVGACDQHGPHLPVGAGTVVVEALVADLAREFGVLRAPTFHYGVTVPGERDMAGTAGLRPKTLHRALNELLAAWSCQGFEEFIAVTANRFDPHVEALATVRTAGARVRVVEALSVDLSQFLEAEGGPEHAGEALTSLVLHLRPEAVRMDRARDFPVDVPTGGRPVARLARLPEGCPGSVGRPTRASAEKGRQMYEHILQKIRHKVFIAPPPAPTEGA
ncbi:MAG TPA: creatininase family protein [Longimicrobium sp.]|jgi:creatinine amidohydrolase